ncbi:MAG: QsdR family transcriptional regulator [Jatrophihabitantaceae bacterium]
MTATASRADASLVVPSGVAPPASIPADVFTAALRAYLSGQKLDMRALARRLGVGRSTLYRRAGNREQLLDEVIWWRSRRALTAAVASSAALRGVPRVVAVVNTVLRGAIDDGALHAFLDSEPGAALRILTGARSTVQQGMTRTLENLIDLEVARGHLRLGLDTPTLTYAIVRISEGFLYSDIIADRTPDVERASTVIAALLRGLDSIGER